ncbi:hypothetical protein [Haladaptatus litoreus]|uniref:hypothetical protein n=1 Tax=Haladaptatus litoreus TaxID=553468 RepID=UPI001588E1C6|nr:hypothetical protein [Haladaptatus litoreus]
MGSCLTIVRHSPNALAHPFGWVIKLCGARWQAVEECTSEKASESVRGMTETSDSE